MILRYEYQGHTYSVNLEQQPDGSYVAVVDGREYAVDAQRSTDGGLLLTIEGQKHRAYSVTQNNERFVHLDGQTYTLSVPDTRSRRKSATGGGGLVAQMPGQVIEVLVTEGESVQSGQTLVIMEAMKMEIRVTAPKDGTIQQVRVQVGDVVERGQKLIEIESLD